MSQSEDRKAPAGAQPWHAADEKKPNAANRGAPIGTHSLTGGGAAVGMPQKPAADDAAERSAPRDEAPGAEEPDITLEPRAGRGDLLGRKD
jgi:hypothetical protein